VKATPVTFAVVIVTDRLAGLKVQPAFDGVTAYVPAARPESVKALVASLVAVTLPAVTVAPEVPALPDTEKVAAAAIVTVRVAVPLALPQASVAVAVIVWEDPAASPEVFHEDETEPEVAVATVIPSIARVIDVTPTLSEPVAVTVTVPLTVVAAGAAIEAVGTVVSEHEARLTQTGAEKSSPPFASVA
jgi:hypothetical protein